MEDTVLPFLILSILNICKAGDHIISVSSLYGGTVNLFNVHLKNLGIEVTFVDPDASEEEILKVARENTKASLPIKEITFVDEVPADPEAS